MKFISLGSLEIKKKREDLAILAHIPTGHRRLEQVRGPLSE